MNNLLIYKAKGDIKLEAEGIINSVLGKNRPAGKPQTITQESSEGVDNKKYTLEEARAILEPEFLGKAEIAFENAKAEWLDITQAILDEERIEAEGE